MAREYGLWFHVDGAYGGAGLFAPSVRHKYDGIEHADSFIVDPHKWLFAPFDCAALLYRDPSLARSVHKQDASYLDVIHDTPGEWNPTDYAYHLTGGPGACRCGSRCRLRRRRLHRGHRGGDRAWPARPRRRSRPATTWN